MFLFNLHVFWDEGDARKLFRGVVATLSSSSLHNQESGSCQSLHLLMLLLRHPCRLEKPQEFVKSDSSKDVC